MFTMKRASAITVISPFIWMLVLGISCQKDPDEPTKTRTELLTTGSWHLVSHTTNPPADLDGDGTADDTDVLVTYEAVKKMISPVSAQMEQEPWMRALQNAVPPIRKRLHLSGNGKTMKLSFPFSVRI